MPSRQERRKAERDAAKRAHAEATAAGAVATLANLHVLTGTLGYVVGTPLGCAVGHALRSLVLL